MASNFFQNIIVQKQQKHNRHFEEPACKNQARITNLGPRTDPKGVIVIDDSEDEDKKDIVIIIDDEEDQKNGANVNVGKTLDGTSKSTQTFGGTNQICTPGTSNRNLAFPFENARFLSKDEERARTGGDTQKYTMPNDTVGAKKNFVAQRNTGMPSKTNTQGIGVIVEGTIGNATGSVVQAVESFTSVDKTDKDKPFQCNLCPKRFTHKSNLYTHRKVHNAVREKYPCEVCGRSFLYRCSLKLHIATHMKGHQFTCKVCRENFESEVSLKTHEAEKHAQGSGQLCDICNRVFKSKSGLMLHRRTHSGKHCLCTECGRAFKFRNHLLLHMRSHKTSSNQCDVCQRSFRSKVKLAAHKEAHLGRRHPCEICLKAYGSEAYLRSHHNSHARDSGCYCDVYSNRFKQNYLGVHKCGLGHVCEVCHRGFPFQCWLDVHKQRKHTARNFACDVCFKQFKQRTYLNIHKLSHTGAYKFFCKFCQKGFPFVSRLNAHEPKCVKAS